MKQDRQYITKEFKFVEKEKLRAAKRPRKGKFSIYVPDASKNKKEIREAIKDQIPEDYVMIHNQISLEFIGCVPIPKKFSKADREKALNGELRPIVKPDLDNIIKPYLDAFNDYIWMDDAQIVDLKISKFYGEEPSVEIRITYPTDYISQVQKTTQLKKMKAKGYTECLI